MNDEAAFVAAIKAAPEDRNLPLVFADWLDDRGDPRGQWIRNDFIRKWMRPSYADPIPKLLAAIARNYHIRLARRAAIAIGAPIVPGLIELLKNPSNRAQELACRCLRGIGKRAAAAAPALLDLLNDPTLTVRIEAARTLRAVGVSDDTHAARLQAALSDTSHDVRQSARRVLVSMGEKGSVLQDLLDRFASPDAKDRLHAVHGFQQIGTAEIVPQLERALDDADARVRQEAVAALGALGRLPRTTALVTPILCRAFYHRETQVRMLAASQFGRFGTAFTPAVVGALTGLLSDPSPEVRAEVCSRLENAKDLAAPAVPQLTDLLNDPEGKVRVRAIRALTVLGKGDPAALAALVVKLDDPDPEHRKLAVSAVGAVGRGDPVALAALVRHIDDSNDPVTAAVLVELGGWPQLPASLAPALLAKLADPRARLNASRAMGRLSPAPPEVIETLRAELRNPAPTYRGVAMEALGAIGPAAVAAVPELLAAIAEVKQQRVRFGCTGPVKALARMGSPGLERLAELLAADSHACGSILWSCSELRDAALPLLPALLDRLHRLTGTDHRDTLAAIRHLGPGATAAIPVLLDGLATWELSSTRTEALRTLTEFGPALLPYLSQLNEVANRTGTPELYQAFAVLLARFAPQEPSVREPLCDLLRLASHAEPDEKSTDRAQRKLTRQKCATALMAFNDPALLPALAPLVADPEPDVRASILAQLGGFDAPEALPLIRQALDDPDENLRVQAIEVVTDRADTSEEAIAGLVRTVEDRSPKVRRAAVCSLGKLKVQTELVRDALTAATADDDKRVAASAHVALKKLGSKGRKASPATPKPESLEQTAKEKRTKTKSKKKPT